MDQVQFLIGESKPSVKNSQKFCHYLNQNQNHHVAPTVILFHLDNLGIILL